MSAAGGGGPNLNAWKALLDFSTRHTEPEPNPDIKPISKEDAAFLKEALASVAVDQVDRMKELTKDLDFDESAADAAVIARKEAALEELADWVDDINNANDLKSIGGLAVLMHHLASAHPGIRWRACEVLGIMVQNNPKAQEQVMSAGALPILLSLLRSDTDTDVRVKALLAISSLVRHNESALTDFVAGGGVVLLKLLISHADDRLARKSLFLTSYLMDAHAHIASQALDDDLISSIIERCASNDPDMRDCACRILAALFSTPNAVGDNARAKAIELGLQAKLESIAVTLQQAVDRAIEEQSAEEEGARADLAVVSMLLSRLHVHL